MQTNKVFLPDFVDNKATGTITVSLQFESSPSINYTLFLKDGETYYWASQWQKGVWGKKDLKSERLFPLFVENLEEALEWEVVE